VGRARRSNVVRKAKSYTFLEIHRVAFPDGPPRPRSLKELEEGIREYIRGRHEDGRY